MKNAGWLRWLGVFAVIIWGGTLSIAAVASPSAIQSVAGHPGNFYANPGLTEGLAAYVGKEVFVVQVPAGDYRLYYKTNLGEYNLVLRASATALLYVGLATGDQVIDATIYPGTITNTSGATQTHGLVTLFMWPGGPVTDWNEVFRVQ